MYFLINLIIVVVYLVYLLAKKTKINAVAFIGIFVLGIFIPVPILKILF